MTEPHKEAAPEEELPGEEQQALATVLDSPELVERVLNSQQVQIMVSSRKHSGPLPSPENLEHYNQIIPNGAERIMRMAEEEQQNRFANDAAANAFNTRGQLLGFASVLLIIGFALFLLFTGHPGLAVTVVTGTIVSIAGVFALGRKS